MIMQFAYVYVSETHVATIMGRAIRTLVYIMTKLCSNALCNKNSFCNKMLKFDFICIFQLKIKRNLCTHINKILFQKVKTETLHNTCKNSKNPFCNTNV